MRASISRILVGLALTLVPSVALACPVCGADTGDNAWAYTVMSVVLTVLPLGMIGGVVYWVARREGSAHVPEHQDTVQFRSTRDR
jgi:hypothetical protein